MYVMARTAKKRPTLQHVVRNPGMTLTVCGTDISSWSRVWQRKQIPILLCRRCARIERIEIKLSL